MVDVDSLIGEAIASSRRLTTELNPPVPQQGGLTSILEYLAKWMQDMHGLKVKVVAPGRSEVLPENIAFSCSGPFVNCCLMWSNMQE